jgi:arylsulfatase A-like enzyme
MYEDAVNVPFIISYPKLFKQNVVNNTNVSFIDLMPTLAELIDGKTPTTAQGISLVNLLKNNNDIKDRVVFSEFRGADYTLLPKEKNVPSRMMKKGDFKFIYTHGIIDQLYDVKNDSDELNNLIFSDKHKKIYKEMYFQTLAEWRFQEYSPIHTTLKKNEINWKDSTDFKEYALYYSKTADSKNAILVKDNIQKYSISVKEKGYYWIVATPKLTKTSNFYGDKIPVAVDKYSFTLPVSDAVLFN